MSNREIIVEFLRWLAGLEPQKQPERILIPVDSDEQPRHPREHSRR